MPGRLDGRVAIVSGGASGIGRACALRFAEEGAAVVVADLHREPAEETVRLIEAGGGEALAAQLDITQAEDNEAIASLAMAQFGRLDVLVAAAGILHGRYVSGVEELGQRDRMEVIEKPIEWWEKVLAVNLTGTMLTNRAVARQMIAAGTGGSIVNIASAAAIMPLAGSAEYCVSKAGVLMLTRVLALELAPRGIRVNAIGPGSIATPMIAATLNDEARKRQAEKDTPLGRIGDPVDIANAALYLASDESSFMTGEAIYPTGGRTVGWANVR